ncbi:MAG: PVC-type heme-binding CxxCH protein [Planctomycetota bacterium]
MSEAWGGTGQTWRLSRGAWSEGWRRLRLLLLGLLLLLSLFVLAGESSGQLVESADSVAPVEPVVAGASDEAERQLTLFRLPAGWRGTVWAAEPMVANPVAFAIDSRGRIYVCESFRQEQGVTDNRSHDERWVDRDLAAKTVSDRIAYHEELLPNRGADYRRQEDRVRWLEDADGDGRADLVKVFANRFHALEDGTLAGVLPLEDGVLLTNIPHLWRLRDLDQDGQAEIRESLQAGFGVRVAFRGHDMHGLVQGPDGRIYFSIGDRGYHLTTADGRLLADPESGAVFRCEPDGSRLEVVATGLRNPQELAFDDFGNLFTGDNNSDSGDRARWVCVLPGADSGWRMAYQYLPDRGPFNRERIWEPLNSQQPAYVFPPVANVADGPSGLIYYPGTGVGRDLERSFLLCDFRGTPGVSGIRRIRIEAEGAFFRLQSADELLWQVLATDCAIGPDGWLYVSDWVNGWVGENKGRIYRFGDPSVIEQPEVREVAARLERGLSDEPESELGRSLGHRDQRLRMAAQFELVRRGSQAALQRAAQTGESTLERVHGIWGLAQLARCSGEISGLSCLSELLADPDPEVRAQAAKIAGEQGLEPLVESLAQLARDRRYPRVQLFASLAFRRLTHPRPAELLDELTANADRDPALRHGLVMALSGQDLSKLVAERGAELDSAAGRGLVVALRKQQSPLVRRFLTASSVPVAEEAARAVYDLPLKEVLPDLAAIGGKRPESEVLTRRALHAAYRLGGEADARQVAAMAIDRQLPESLRKEALELLAAWETPSPRDRILGMWRPIEPRPVAPARAAFSAVAGELLAGTTGDLRVAAVETAGRLRVESAGAQLLALAGNTVLPGRLRSACVRALGHVPPSELETQLVAWANDLDPEVRTAAMEVLVARQPELALKVVEGATESADLRERQAAWKQLGRLALPQVAEVLATGLRKLQDNQIPADTRLDLIEAVRQQAAAHPALRDWLATYEAEVGADPVQRYRDAIAGGDAERGRIIFKEWTNLSCLRCHRIGDEGGYVGPNLSDIGTRKDRQYLLESLVDPNRAIADKYETTIVLDAEGKTFSGIVNFEDAQTLRLLTAEGEMVTLDKQEIDERTTGKSAMPADLIKHLAPADVRDLVEYLAVQRQSPASPSVESLERTDR